MARFNPSRHYASSRPVEWLRVNVFKIEKPTALPWGGWEEWDDKLKSSRPIAYFLTEVFPVWLESIPNYTIKYLYDLRIYASNVNNNSHCLSSKLEKGRYHEFDTRILHSLFDSFVDYIEIDEAYRHIQWSDATILAKYKVPFFTKHSLNWGKAWPCPEAGIDHLKWEMSLGEEKENGKFGNMQSQSAIEKMTLYTWWKTIRPARGDSWDASGFRAFWNTMDEKYGSEFDNPSKKRKRGRGRRGWLLNGTLTASERKKYDALSTAKDELEKQWDIEDEQMMIRLIKLRRTLWT